MGDHLRQFGVVLRGVDRGSRGERRAMLTTLAEASDDPALPAHLEPNQLFAR